MCDLPLKTIGPCEINSTGLIKIAKDFSVPTLSCSKKNSLHVITQNEVQHMEENSACLPK